MVPASRQEPVRCPFLSPNETPGSLAKTLMVCVTLFKAGSGYSVAPTSEFDGDPASVVHEYDPWA